MMLISPSIPVPLVLILLVLLSLKLETINSFQNNNAHVPSFKSSHTSSSIIRRLQGVKDRRTSLSASTIPRSNNDVVDNIQNLFNSIRKKTMTKTGKNNNNNNVIQMYFDSWNRKDINKCISYFDIENENITITDTMFSKPFVGINEIQRYLLLMSNAYPTINYVIDDIVIDGNSDSSSSSNDDNDIIVKVGVKWHKEEKTTQKVIPNSRTCSFYTISKKSNKILSSYDFVEPAIKLGTITLNILSAANLFIETVGIDNADEMSSTMVSTTSSSASSSSTGSINTQVKKEATKNGHQVAAGVKYFNSWNERNMDNAISLFTNDCQYEDTVYPQPFQGKELLKEHLLKCSNAFPSTFEFIIDDIALNDEDNDNKQCILWHLENNGDVLPFTRGCSFYTTTTNENKKNLIQTGFDIVEPPVIKAGGISLLFNTIREQIQKEPIRIVPIICWILYMYIVFLSDGILPGANALQLEQRTWEEVLNLSINFFLVSPILHLPFSPTVHPMLEGVFNLLLSWAALFIGFISDDRDESIRNNDNNINNSSSLKANILPMLPIVVGMQFLTSAFLLPYLATRSSEEVVVVDKEKDDIDNSSRKVVYIEDVNTITKVAGESRVLGPFLGGVGLLSIVWFFIGRYDDYGSVYDGRWQTFIDLLSIDRVGSSFIVDLIIFGLFQGWLVDDDLRRRGVNIIDNNNNSLVLTDDKNSLADENNNYSTLRKIAKYVPFFGMAIYMTLRPPLPSRAEEDL